MLKSIHIGGTSIPIIRPKGAKNPKDMFVSLTTLLKAGKKDRLGIKYWMRRIRTLQFLGELEMQMGNKNFN